MSSSSAASPTPRRISATAFSRLLRRPASFPPCRWCGPITPATRWPSRTTAAGNTYRIRGLFWFHGEGDRYLSSTYAAKFNGLLSQLAADLNHGEPVPFGITLIAYNTSYVPPPSQAEVDGIMALREVQRGIATNATSGSYADSWDYPRADIWHVLINDGPPDSLTRFGSALGNAFLAAQFTTWQGDVSSDWGNPANWDTGAIPAGTDTAVFNDTAATATPTRAPGNNLVGTISISGSIAFAFSFSGANLPSETPSP